jgi:hypothetical protein
MNLDAFRLSYMTYTYLQVVFELESAVCCIENSTQNWCCPHLRSRQVWGPPLFLPHLCRDPSFSDLWLASPFGFHESRCRNASASRYLLFQALGPLPPGSSSSSSSHATIYNRRAFSALLATSQLLFFRASCTMHLKFSSTGSLASAPFDALCLESAKMALREIIAK